MTPNSDGLAVPRHLVFVLKDGSFVVQWEIDRVQDLLTGETHPFRDVEYGHAITDQELNHLRDAASVAGYDPAYVWLYALPEGERRLRVREETPGRVKYFYLNTTLPGQYLQQVQQRLQQLGLDEKYAARERLGLIAIVRQDGNPFARLVEAENAQQALRRAAPKLLADAAVAFIEYDAHSAPPGEDLSSMDVLDLDTLIASQTGSLAGEGKVVVGADRDEQFLATLGDTLADVGVRFIPATSGQQALRTIEDLKPDLVLMDLILPDTHAWQILARMRANQTVAKIPVIIITALGTQTDQVFALTVAKVHDYLVKPVAPGRLRQSVWTALKGLSA